MKSNMTTISEKIGEDETEIKSINNQEDFQMIIIKMIKGRIVIKDIQINRDIMIEDKIDMMNLKNQMLIIINEMTDMMVVEKIKIGFMITIMIIMIKKKYKGIIQVT